MVFQMLKLKVTIATPPANSSGNSSAVDKRFIILATGLSSNTSANDLKNYFRKSGRIGRITIMTNTKVADSQKFAHISVPSLKELHHLVENLDGTELKGKKIRLLEAPDNGSLRGSYEIALAMAANQKVEDDKVRKGSGGNAKKQKNGSKMESTKIDGKPEKSKEKKVAGKGKERKGTPPHTSRKDFHEKDDGSGSYRRQSRGFRRSLLTPHREWRRRPMVSAPRGRGPVEVIQRDRFSTRGHGYPSKGGARHPSAAHSQLTFERIRVMLVFF